MSVNNPNFLPCNLLEERFLNDAIVIEIPHDPNVTIQDDVELLNTVHLPMMSDSSIHTDPEYIDPILEVQNGRKRKIINKRKEKKENEKHIEQ